MEDTSKILTWLAVHRRAIRRFGKKVSVLDPFESLSRSSHLQQILQEIRQGRRSSATISLVLTLTPKLAALECVHLTYAILQVTDIDRSAFIVSDSV